MYLCYKNKRVGLGMCVCVGGGGGGVVGAGNPDSVLVWEEAVTSIYLLS